MLGKTFFNFKFLACLLACCLLFPSFALSREAAIKPVDSQALLNYVEKDGKGKVVVVNIFASWCPPCGSEVPELVALRAKYPAEKVLFAGVSVDEDMQALRKFMDDKKINYPVFLATGDFSRAFGVSAIPQLLIFDKEGELQINYTGLAERSELISTIDSFLK